jgi:uncharacterized caspase-like protein
MRAKHHCLRYGVALTAALVLTCTSALAAENRNLAVDKKAAGAERRLALVIGNGAYGSAPLRNPTNDARSVAQALSGLGFEVAHQENLGLKAMARSIRDFGNKLKQNGGMGLFYYAGHGMQVKGRNYLIPVDADIQSEDEIAFNAVDANLVLEKMDAANNGLNVVILDACRNNPFARSFRSAAQGLAQMDAPSGTLIAFATAPGSVASDGEGSNGVYTKYLIEYMSAPGVPVEQLFKRVRIGVTRETRDRQVPWESSSLKGDFYFKPAQVAAVTPVPRTTNEVSADTIELAFWESIKASRTISDFEAYLEQYPKGRFAGLARSRLKQLGEEARERPLALEMAYWDSIKTSRSVADFESYLEQYPKGRFATIARNRVSELKAQAAPANQVATAAAPAVAANTSNAMPRVGDTWTYRYVDGWKGEIGVPLTYQVTQVSAKEIRENYVVGGQAPLALAHTKELKVAAEHLGPQPRVETFPYLAAFGIPEEKEQWDDVTFVPGENYKYRGEPWQLKARVVGRETVKVPAGRFKALRIELTGDRARIPGYFGESVSTKHTLWYAPEVKRVVRHEFESTNGIGKTSDRGVYELLSYKLK